APTGSSIWVLKAANMAARWWGRDRLSESQLFRPVIPGNTYEQCWRENETHRTHRSHVFTRGTHLSRSRRYLCRTRTGQRAAFRRRARGGGRAVAVVTK